MLLIPLQIILVLVEKHGLFDLIFVFMGPVLVVLGLPPTGSWQDLKDHMREAGDVCFADVQRDGEGVVEFLRREDMEYALRRLDGTEFRSHQVTHTYPETLNIQIHNLCI